jgi:large subunit ribosomal protein L24
VKTKSKKPRAQRKAMANAPHHRRRKFLSAPLSDDLRAKYGLRNLPIRKGDTVRVMRGDFSGIEGKVIRVDRERARIFVEGITRESVSGEAKSVPIHASKVMITALDLSDKWRAEALEERAKARAEASA